MVSVVSGGQRFDPRAFMNRPQTLDFFQTEDKALDSFQTINLFSQFEALKCGRRMIDVRSRKFSIECVCACVLRDTKRETRRVRMREWMCEWESERNRESEKDSECVSERERNGELEWESERERECLIRRVWVGARVCALRVRVRECWPACVHDFFILLISIPQND